MTTSCGPPLVPTVSVSPRSASVIRPAPVSVSSPMWAVVVVLLSVNVPPPLARSVSLSSVSVPVASAIGAVNAIVRPLAAGLSSLPGSTVVPSVVQSSAVEPRLSLSAPPASVALTAPLPALSVPPRPSAVAAIQLCVPLTR